MNHLQLPVVITPTRIETGARCYRRHFLGDVLNKALYSSPSLEFGSLLHAAASAYWLGQEWRSVVTQEWINRFVTTNVSQDSVSLEMAMGMMEYYVANAQLAGPFQDAADDWKLVDVEQRFEIPINTGTVDLVKALQSFQMDRVVYSQSQNWLLIGDLKSAARLDKRWERQWETSLQMKLYKLGVQTVFGHEGKLDVFIEGLHKNIPSKIQYYSCPEWSNLELGEAAYNAMHIAKMDHELIEASRGQLEYAEELGVRYTPFNYGDCYAYNTECPFHRVCTADVPERAPILRAEFFEKTEEDY